MKKRNRYKTVNKTVKNSYYRFTRYYRRAHHIKKDCLFLKDVMTFNNEYPVIRRLFKM